MISNIFELHLFALIAPFKHEFLRGLALIIGLYGSEIAFFTILIPMLTQMYCIGNGMTFEELRHPERYMRSR